MGNNSRGDRPRNRVCVTPPRQRDSVARTSVYTTRLGRHALGPTLCEAKFVTLSEASKTILLLDNVERLFRPKLSGQKWTLTKTPTALTVRELAELLVHLWPIGHAPQPYSSGSNELAAVYWGRQSPGAFQQSVARTSLYCDKILCPNPFVDLTIYNPDTSPLVRPDDWISSYAAKALYLASLQEWIEAGIVQLYVPVSRTLPEMKARYGKLAKESRNALSDIWLSDSSFVIEAASEFLIDVPDTYANTFLSDGFEKLAPAIKGRLKEMRDTEPIYTPKGSYSTDQYVHTGTGSIFEETVDYAQLMNAVIVSDSGIFGRIFRNLQGKQGPMEAVSAAMQRLQMSFLNDVPAKFAIEIRRQGRLEEFRRFLRDTATNAATGPDGSFNVDRITDSLSTQYEQYKYDWSEIQRQVMLDSAVAIAPGAAAVLTGTLGLISGAATTLPGPIYSLYKGVRARRALARKPIGVLIDLERR